jgi:nitric oxide reductase NorD protein
LEIERVRSLWLGPHLLDEPGGAAAHRAAEELGPEIHEQLLSHGDRLAEISPVLAQQYYRNAAAAWRNFDADGFASWVELGSELATGEPACRDGANAFFSVAPEALGDTPLATASAWCAIARETSAVSVKLAAIFLKTTTQMLSAPTAVATLSHWAEIGRDLYHQHGWQGEFLAQAYFSSAPGALRVLHPEAFRLWAGAANALYPAVKEREFFGSLPATTSAWPGTDQAQLLRVTITLAADAPKAAFAVYTQLPVSLAAVEPSIRQRLLGLLAVAGRNLGGTINDLVPIAGALLQQVPEATLGTALSHCDEVAERAPAALVNALRSLPRLYEEADEVQVRRWFDGGLEIASNSKAAGLAYFALQSRTSLKILRDGSTAASLDESQGLLRKYIQMLSGEQAGIRPADRFSLRPALEEFPGEREVCLPTRIDLFQTHEENLRLYRLLAAQLVGRRLFGTYDVVLDEPEEEIPPGGALYRYLSDDERPEILAELFTLAEALRIHHRLCAEFRGLRGEGEWAADLLLRGRLTESSPTRNERLDTLLALCLLDHVPEQLPRWLDTATVQAVNALLAPLCHSSATANDSLHVARMLADFFTAHDANLGAEASDMDGSFYETVAGEMMYDPYDDDDAPAPIGAGESKSEDAQSEDAKVEEQDLSVQLDEERAPDGAGEPMSPEELRRLLESGVKMKIRQGQSEEDQEGLGLYITDLLGKLPSEQIEELRKLLGEPDKSKHRAPRNWLDRGAAGVSYWYDEWDYHIDDYRSRWCRLVEIGMEGDSGEFFNGALADYSALIPEVRRQFQLVRPEMYRTVRGLEDGEDFDLNAVIAARADARAGVAPSNRLYVARKREERDVATLFLVDMSASTDEPLSAAESGQPPNGEANGRPEKNVRRIIDVTKETLVIMAQALEEIGDAYAIYGFSGHGRDNVEMYRVKSFAESLTTSVKGRLGGVEPKRSTRMGTALRHAVEKMASVSARCKHLFLLSDGFPQDFDYGQDRRSNLYGIRDTAVALREAESAGVTPFCITVDKAGHDYLRQMCDESRYMVIEDIAALPRELPKIYQRIVRT